jgi:hypothetical protein
MEVCPVATRPHGGQTTAFQRSHGKQFVKLPAQKRANVDGLSTWSLLPYHGGVKATNGTLPALVGTGEFGMTTTTFGIVFLIGAALGLHFRVWILIPFAGLAIVGTALEEMWRGERVLSLILRIAFIITILQIGYFIGLLMDAVVDSRIVANKLSPP